MLLFILMEPRVNLREYLLKGHVNGEIFESPVPLNSSGDYKYRLAEPPRSLDEEWLEVKPLSRFGQREGDRVGVFLKQHLGDLIAI